ncbi:cytochrome ubiquinol oxidase subunit I [Sandarakinorhabdus sp.]|uniref:cytochrome ubiquinol oxidase subunit I n=1 Tax=Sandarakinorhabdus sp. TaxID=1916663 RepID=UPI00286E67AC|nr:cytochrome ubiquinol oxidase subunit I [Sandarakinorhabdus sp.]
MFDDFSALTLARMQFAFTVSFHFIFPAFSIGLASFLAVLEGLWLKTGRDVYLSLFQYWLKIFAIVFGMGVVSGIVMAYQFGSNWAVFSDKAGPVIGPLMAYEVLTAFFMESGFLGVMLFGLNRVGKRLHFAATCLVAAGTTISAFWIIAVNSWMQTPQGYGIAANGQFYATDWLAVIFNPSMPYRLVHVVLGAYLTTALVVGGVGAWHLLRDRRIGRTPQEATRIMFSMAMWMAAIVAPMQILAGHEHGSNTLTYQPAKISAMEGHYDSYPGGQGGGAPLILFGIPDDAAQVMRHKVEIPGLGSLVLKNDLAAPMDGLDKVAPENRAKVTIPFFAFRIMVGLGVLMLVMGLWSLWARARGNLFAAPWLHRMALAMGPSGFVAVLAGWITTEVGRQPFTIFGVLRTADSASPLAAPAVAASLVAFVIVYFFVFGVGTWFILKLMNDEPGPGEPIPGPETAIEVGSLPPEAAIALAE